MWGEKKKTLKDMNEQMHQRVQMWGWAKCLTFPKTHLCTLVHIICFPHSGKKCLSASLHPLTLRRAMPPAAEWSYKTLGLNWINLCLTATKATDMSAIRAVCSRPQPWYVAVLLRDPAELQARRRSDPHPRQRAAQPPPSRGDRAPSRTPSRPPRTSPAVPSGAGQRWSPRPSHSHLQLHVHIQVAAIHIIQLLSLAHNDREPNGTYTPHLNSPRGRSRARRLGPPLSRMRRRGHFA